MPKAYKSVLTDSAYIAALPERDQAGAHEIVRLFEPQRRLIKQLLRLFFTIAGFSWFFVFFPDYFGIDAAVRQPFTVNQYQIYLILLTLWGFELKRHEKRLSFLLNLSATLNKPWYHLSADDFRESGKMHLLEVLTKKDASDRRYLHVGFMWLLIGLVIIYFIRQAVLLVGG